MSRVIGRILVGYDGSEIGTRALDRACELAIVSASPLTVLTAAVDRLVRADGVVTLAEDEDRARRLADTGARLARERGVPAADARVSTEAPGDALVHAANAGYDLVVVGHRGLGAVKEFFLGSTAKAVVDRARCSVLVVK